MKLAIYGHGGSENHGNEAIVRGVRKLFPEAELTVYSFSKEADKHFGLDEICKVKNMIKHPDRMYVTKVIRHCTNRCHMLNEHYYKIVFSPFLKEIDTGTIYLLEAGDQYCEMGEHRIFYRYLNRQIRRKGAKSIMLGCTINPELLEDRNLIKDLRNYSMVIARESLTYHALTKAGVDAVLAPCPAFAMKAEECHLHEWMIGKKFIGFNAGFLAQGNEKYYRLLMKNYEKAVEWTLRNTDLDVALIPHVNWNYRATDFTALDRLFRKFKKSGRVHYVNEHNAARQKYIISKCTAFVTLRTHAAIAGIGGQVPTLITGYKTKSRGIAADIFDGAFDMLADVQSLENEWTVTQKLQKILEQNQDIREYYKYIMPGYLSGLNIIADKISNL